MAGGTRCRCSLQPAACSLQPRAQPRAATPCTQTGPLYPARSPVHPARHPMHHGTMAAVHHAFGSGARTRRARVCWASSAASLTVWRGTRTAPKGGATRRRKAVQTSSRRAEALHLCCVLEAAALGVQAAPLRARLQPPPVSRLQPHCTLHPGGLQPVAQDRGGGPLSRGVHAAIGRGDGAQRADDVRPTPQV